MFAFLYKALIAISLLFGLKAAPSFAHDLSNNTIRIQLRDNHFRILIDVAILDWLSQVDNKEGKRNPTFGAEQIPVRLNKLKTVLRKETHLSSMQETAKIKILVFPTEREILDMLYQFSLARQQQTVLPHGFGRYTIQLEGSIKNKIQHKATASFPTSLGKVFVSFEEPNTKFIEAGSLVSFPISSKSNNHALPWMLLSLVSAVLLYTWTNNKHSRPKGAKK